MPISTTRQAKHAAELSDSDGPLPGFEPPGPEPTPYPGQLSSNEPPPYPGYQPYPSVQQPPYPGYQQAPYPGYPAMPGMGAAPPVRRPASVVLAFRLILLGAALCVAMVVLSFVLGADALDKNLRSDLAKDGAYTESDLQAYKAGVIGVVAVLVAIPMALFVVFGFVMRSGRNWARVTLTVLLSLGLLAAVIEALVPTFLPARLLAILLFVVNVGVLVAMFQSSAAPHFDRRARMAGWTT
jgi:hypothetical protein